MLFHAKHTQEKKKKKDQEKQQELENKWPHLQSQHSRSALKMNYRKLKDRLHLTPMDPISYAKTKTEQL